MQYEKCQSRIAKRAICELNENEQSSLQGHESIKIENGARNEDVKLEIL